MMPASVDKRPLTAVQLQFTGIGDLVWHAQYFRCVAEQSRDGKVTVLAPPSAMAREVIGHEPWVREVIDFDRRPRRSERRRGRHSGLDGLMRMGAELAPRKLERMVMFSDHPGRTLIVCWRAGIPVRIAYGVTWLQRKLLTPSPWIRKYDGPGVHGYHEATAFAIAQGYCDAPIVPRISVRPDALARMQQRLAGLPRPVHAVSFGCSEPFKQWGLDNFTALTALLREAGHGVLLVGGPADAAGGQAIIDAIAPQLRGGVMALTDVKLSEAIAALSLGDTCSGNDTGPINAAAAVGTPTWVVLGPRRLLTHDPERLKMIQAPSLAEITPAEVARQLLAARPG